MSRRLTSHSILYRLFRGRFLQVSRPNQQCESTEGSQLATGIGFSPTRTTPLCYNINCTQPTHRAPRRHTNSRTNILRPLCRSPSTSSPSSVSTIDAKALRQISADAGSPTPSGGVATEQVADREGTDSPRSTTEPAPPPPASEEVDRKALVRQRWITAINRVRDQVSQVKLQYNYSPAVICCWH